MNGKYHRLVYEFLICFQLYEEIRKDGLHQDPCYCRHSHSSTGNRTICSAATIVKLLFENKKMRKVVRFLRKRKDFPNPRSGF